MLSFSYLFTVENCFQCESRIFIFEGLACIMQFRTTLLICNIWIKPTSRIVSVFDLQSRSSLLKGCKSEAIYGKWKKFAALVKEFYLILHAFLSFLGLKLSNELRFRFFDWLCGPKFNYLLPHIKIFEITSKISSSTSMVHI